MSIITDASSLNKAIQAAGYSPESFPLKPIPRNADYLTLKPELFDAPVTRIIDDTGRKGIAFKVKDATGNGHVITVHQRDFNGKMYVVAEDNEVNEIYYNSENPGHTNRFTAPNDPFTGAHVRSRVITDLLKGNGPVKLDGELPAKTATSSGMSKCLLVATAVTAAISAAVAYFRS